MVKLNPGDKICIVGGGTTGLYVLKACLEHNLIPTVFEAADSVGGVWRSKGPGGLAYDSLHTNSSSLLTCASPWDSNDIAKKRIPTMRKTQKKLPSLEINTEELEEEEDRPSSFEEDKSSELPFI